MARAKCPNCNYSRAVRGLHKLQYAYQDEQVVVYLKGIKCTKCQNLNLTKVEADFFEKSKDRMASYVESKNGKS